jgi:hypothetical protein
VDAINAALTTVTDWVLSPVARWSPALVLILVSAVCGVAMAWVYGRTSNQTTLRKHADRAKAHLLGMKVFNGEAMVVLHYQADLLKTVGLRLACALPPVLVLIVPIGIVLTQLAVRYEHRPLEPGEAAVVELQIDEQDWEIARNAALEAPPGVAVETPAVRDAHAHSVFWRIRRDDAAEEVATLRWRAAGQTISKHLAADGQRLTRASVRRPGRDLFDRLLHPAEPAVPSDSVFSAVIVHYPARVTPILGIDIPWWAPFLIVSMLAALAASPFLKVKF